MKNNLTIEQLKAYLTRIKKQQSISAPIDDLYVESVYKQIIWFGMPEIKEVIQGFIANWEDSFRMPTAQRFHVELKKASEKLKYSNHENLNKGDRFTRPTRQELQTIAMQSSKLSKALKGHGIKAERNLEEAIREVKQSIRG